MQPVGPFCQSCGMPLSQQEFFGTEANGSKNQKLHLLLQRWTVYSTRRYLGTDDTDVSEGVVRSRLNRFHSASHGTNDADIDASGTLAPIITH